MSQVAQVLEVGLRRLDNAIARLEEHADTLDPVLISAAYAELLQARGILRAVAQVEHLTTEIAGKPSTLRLVKR